MSKPLSLRFVEAGEPGYTRVITPSGIEYRDAKGRKLGAARTIARLNALALPPAYSDTWFARDARAHIQATGIDARGRKQYRYHADFRAAQDDAKYARCLAFGQALPALRRRVDRDLARRGLCRDRVVAAVVRLLDLVAVRVGNDAYARANRSFGATTLRNRHAQVKGTRVQLRFTGKSGKEQSISIADRRLAGLVARCRDTDGDRLFQYVDEAGELRAVSSGTVNEYVREATGADFTAKHFRTWAASRIAFAELHAAKGQISLKLLLQSVSSQLGNTPAIARKSYVHPALLEAAIEKRAPTGRLPRQTRWMSREERGLIAFLQSST